MPASWLGGLEGGLPSVTACDKLSFLRNVTRPVWPQTSPPGWHQGTLRARPTGPPPSLVLDLWAWGKYCCPRTDGLSLGLLGCGCIFLVTAPGPGHLWTPTGWCRAVALQSAGSLRPRGVPDHVEGRTGQVGPASYQRPGMQRGLRAAAPSPPWGPVPSAGGLAVAWSEPCGGRMGQEPGNRLGWGPWPWSRPPRQLPCNPGARHPGPSWTANRTRESVTHSTPARPRLWWTRAQPWPIRG